MRVILRINGWFVYGLAFFAVGLIAAMMLGICGEIGLRALGFPSLIGLVELTEYALFISTFFAAPYLLRVNQHIRVDILVARIDPATARRLEHGVLLIIIAISLIVGAIGTGILIDSAREGRLVFKDLIIPQWTLDWVIPLSSFVMALQALELLLDLRRESPHHVPGEIVSGLDPTEQP